MSDPEIKKFIEKCLLPASQRLSAEELLKDPFLQVENPKTPVRDPLQLPSQSHKSLNLSKTGPSSMDIDADYNQISPSTYAESYYDSLHSPVLEFQRTFQNNEFRLKGTKKDDKLVSLTLRIAYSCGQYMLFSFFLSI